MGIAAGQSRRSDKTARVGLVEDGGQTEAVGPIGSSAEPGHVRHIDGKHTVGFMD